MKKFNGIDIKNHLLSIGQFLQNEIYVAIEAFDKENMKQIKIKTKPMAGFFSVLRMIFPDIDCLGCYYMGTTNTTKNAIAFIKEFHGKVNPEYKRFAAFLYLYYRHGLMHQHEPKRFRYKGKFVEWSLSLSGKPPRCGHLKRFGLGVQLECAQFCEDTITAIDLYAQTFDDPIKKTPAIKKFNDAIKKMRKPLSKTGILKNDNYKQYLSQKDFDFLKEEIGT